MIYYFLFQCLRSVPSIQRKLLYVVFATGLVSLIYLLSTSSHDTQGPEGDPQKRGVNVDGHFDQQREPSGQTVTKVIGDKGPADRPIVIPEKTNKKDNAEKVSQSLILCFSYFGVLDYDFRTYSIWN